MNSLGGKVNSIALNHNDHVVQVEIAAVRGEIERLRLEKEAAETEARAFEVKLRGMYRSAFEEMERLHAEIQSIHVEQEKRKAEMLNSTRFSFYDAPPPVPPGPPPKPPTPTAEIKRLYRQIAARSHPDKTDDPNMHRLFIAAKSAYEVRDIETIRMVHKAVMTVGDLRAATPEQRRYDLLRIRLDEVKQGLERARNELKAAKSHSMLNAAETYKQRVAAIGQENADREFQAALEQRVFQLRQTVETLKAPPVQVVTQTIFWGRLG